MERLRRISFKFAALVGMMALLASNALAAKAVMQGIPGDWYVVNVDTINKRVLLATSAYSGGVLNVALFSSSNVVVSAGPGDNIILYATGSASFANIRVTLAAVSTPTINTIYSQSFHKGYAVFSGTDAIGAATLYDGLNVAQSSVQKTGTGQYSVTWQQSFADGYYPVSLGWGKGSLQNYSCQWYVKTSTVTKVQCTDKADTAIDLSEVNIIAGGRQ